MSELLRTVGLSKKYRSKYALKDADISIHQGDIYGLIGRNGAGKTTLLKLLNAQITATSGHVLLKGERMAFGKPQVRIGALVESPGLFPDTNAYDNVMYKCIALGKHERGYVEQLLKMVELHDTGKKTVKQFSLGMKQRLAIALAMVAEPELLLLDEPINGMDPQGIRDIREMLVNINKQSGVTILISSHILDELAKFATSYGIIKDGLVLRQFTREQLQKENRSGILITSPDSQRVEEALKTQFGFSAITHPEENSLLVADGMENHEAVSRYLFDRGIYVSQFFVRHESLESYFMKLTGGQP